MTEQKVLCAWCGNLFYPTTVFYECCSGNCQYELDKTKNDVTATTTTDYLNIARDNGLPIVEYKNFYYKPIKCPECGSYDIDMITSYGIINGVTMCFYRFTCKICNNKWYEDD